MALVALAVRLLQRAEYAAANPLADYPIVDALTYWSWAGRIAHGQLADGQPFFSAPLYPYLLGLLRAAGGGLRALSGLQIGLDLATAALLATIGRRRFSAPVGLEAAGLFLLLLEPASFALRVLPQSLQLTLVCLTWLALLAARDSPTAARTALAGASTGLLALAYPPALLCLPIVGVWLWWLGGWTRAGLGRALAGVAAGVVLIAPATVHNHRASGDWFAVQAASGVTLRQGNGPGATGTIVTIPGTSVDREELFRAARRLVERELGRAASWSEVDRHFRDEVFAFWFEDPLRTVRLTARKAWWFLTGRNHGDIYLPTLERAEGLDPRLRLTPLPTAWLVLPALVVLGAWLRRPGEYLPEWMLCAVPLLVVLVFRYSPRYRLPAVPVLVVACAWAIDCARRSDIAARWKAALALAAALGLGLGAVNHAAGFDAREPLRAHFYQTLGDACAKSGRPGRALEYFGKAVALEPGFAQAHANLGNLLLRLRRPEQALDHLRTAVSDAPDNAVYHDQLGRALVMLGRLDEALESFRTAVRLRPDHPGLRNNLANTLRSAGREDEALEQYRTALELDPAHAETHFNLGVLLQDRGDLEAAAHHFREALRLQPDLAPARLRLRQLEAATGS